MSAPENTKPTSPGTAQTVWGIILIVMSILGFFIGLAWTATYYISQSAYPISGLGDANLLVGGFFLVTALPMLIVAIWLLVVGSKRRKALRVANAQ